MYDVGADILEGYVQPYMFAEVVPIEISLQNELAPAHRDASLGGGLRVGATGPDHKGY